MSAPTPEQVAAAVAVAISKDAYSRYAYKQAAEYLSAALAQAQADLIEANAAIREADNLQASYATPGEPLFEWRKLPAVQRALKEAE